MFELPKKIDDGHHVVEWPSRQHNCSNGHVSGGETGIKGKRGEIPSDMVHLQRSVNIFIPTVVKLG